MSAVPSASPLPKASIDWLRLFQRIRNIRRNTRIAAPATPPTTPPTTVDVDGVEESFDSPPLPAAAVLVDVLPEPTPVPPTGLTSVVEASCDDEDVGE